MAVVRTASSQTDTNTASGAMSAKGDTTMHSATARQMTASDACALRFLKNPTLHDCDRARKPFTSESQRGAKGCRRPSKHFGVYQDLSELVKHVLSGPGTTCFVGYSAFSAASVPGIHTQRPRGVRA